MIKRVPGRSRQRGKARVIGRVCLASVPNTPHRPGILDGDHDPGRGTRHSGTGRHSGSLLFQHAPGRFPGSGPFPAPGAGARPGPVSSRPPASRSRTRGPIGRSDRSASPARSARSAGGAIRTDGLSDRTGPGSSTVIDFTGPQRVLEDPGTYRHGPAGPGTSPTTRPRRPGHAGAWAGARDPTSMRNCGRSRSSAAFPTSSSGMIWRPTSPWRRPRAPPSRTPRPGGGRSRPARPGTARTGQPGTAATRRPPNTGPGTHPQPRLGPDDRTAIQPVQPGPQPSATSPAATQPYPAATQPSPVATQPVRAAHQPAESRVAVAYQRGGGSADQPGVLAEAQGKR